MGFREGPGEPATGGTTAWATNAIPRTEIEEPGDDGEESQDGVEEQGRECFGDSSCHFIGEIRHWASMHSALCRKIMRRPPVP